jgi:hypothetical protein
MQSSQENYFVSMLNPLLLPELDNTGRFAKRQAGAGANQFPLECSPWGKDDHYVSTKGVAHGDRRMEWVARPNKRRY